MCVHSTDKDHHRRKGGGRIDRSQATMPQLFARPAKPGDRVNVPGAKASTL